MVDQRDEEPTRPTNDMVVSHMSVARLLDRLEHVKQTGSGRWIACCPAHEDHNPSLSIRELEEGRVLIKCFAGCGALEVLDAVRLTWSTLFPESLDPKRACTPTHSSIPARDLLDIVDHEIMVAALILRDVLDEKIVTTEQWDRLATAAARIGKAKDHGHS